MAIISASRTASQTHVAAAVSDSDEKVKYELIHHSVFQCGKQEGDNSIRSSEVPMEAFADFIFVQTATNASYAYVHTMSPIPLISIACTLPNTLCAYAHSCLSTCVRRSVMDLRVRIARRPEVRLRVLLSFCRGASCHRRA